MVSQLRALFYVLADHRRHMGRLVELRIRFIAHQLFAVSVFRPKRFSFAPHIVLDHTIRRVQNIGGGAVVLFQPNDLCAGEMLFKI